MKLYQQLARLIEARANCIESDNIEWQVRHEKQIESLVKQYLPSGSGFDSGTTIDLSVSSADRLVFQTSFHHMNGNGMYNGWTSHDVVITASLAHGFNLRIRGPDRNQIKEYIADCFSTALGEEIVIPVPSATIVDNFGGSP